MGEKKVTMDITKPGRLVWRISDTGAGYRWQDQDGNLFECRRLHLENGCYTVTDWYDRTLDVPVGEVETLVCGNEAVSLLWRGGPPIDRGRSRILFVASPSWLPAVSTGGGPMLAHAIGSAFLKHGWGVGFVGLVKPERWHGLERLDAALAETGARDTVSSWYAFRKLSAADDAVVAAAIREFDPDIIYCFHAEAAMLARRARPRGRIVAVAWDALHETSIRKHLYAWNGSLRDKLRVVRRIPDIVRRWRLERSEVEGGLAAADFIITHARRGGERYARRLGREVSYFPLPLGTVPPLARKPRHEPPSFLIGGNLGSTVSTTGFRFLLDVLPHLAPSLAANELQIRVTGGGKLQPLIMQALAAYPNVRFLGFVSHGQLLDEYARTVALLVPTPIYIGVRTRILEAFRYGIPTIVHAANKQGFSELEHGRNCLMASDGQGFAALMRLALETPAGLAAVAARARREFETSYSADVFYQSIVGLTGATASEASDDHNLRDARWPADAGLLRGAV